jgi:multidrug efflux pump subunit AcrA (membrane-fusion protein)
MKPASLLAGALPTAVRQPSGERVDLEQLGARFLSSLPVVDTTSRIATWIVDVPQSTAETKIAGGASDLRPGATVVLVVRIGQPRMVLAVPRTAIVELSTRAYVFVQLDGEHFEKRAVTLGDSDGPWIEVLTGVEAGQRIVTRGGFDIHLAGLMGTIESHRH